LKPALHNRPAALIGRALSTILFCGLALSAAAQGKAIKIGVVDSDQITRRSRTIQDAIKQAETQVRPQRDKIEAKTDELQSLRQSLRDRRSVLKQEEVAAEESKIQSLYDEVKDLQRDIDKQFDRAQREIVEPEVKRVMKTIEDVSKREGYDLVVRAEAVLYQSDIVDLTPLVIQELDRAGATTSEPAKPAADAGEKAAPAAKAESAKPSANDDTPKAAKSTRRKRR
jgi:outer membrane protein